MPLHISRERRANFLQTTKRYVETIDRELEAFSDTLGAPGKSSVLPNLRSLTNDIESNSVPLKEYQISYLAAKILVLIQENDIQLARQFLALLKTRIRDLEQGKKEREVKPAVPANETERLAAVHALRQLDTKPEPRFDIITKIAIKMFHVPISTLTLVDKNREWHKSCQGVMRREGARDISFCGHAILSTRPLIIPDAKKDIRFAHNPMVVGKPYIRFYAGIPLLSTTGLVLGTLCLKDRKPRTLRKEELEQLIGLRRLGRTHAECERTESRAHGHSEKSGEIIPP